jgi:uncharacterized protein (DUF1800 family)
MLKNLIQKVKNFFSPLPVNFWESAEPVVAKKQVKDQITDAVTTKKKPRATKKAVKKPTKKK